MQAWTVLTLWHSVFGFTTSHPGRYLHLPPILACSCPILFTIALQCSLPNLPRLQQRSTLDKEFRENQIGAFETDLGEIFSKLFSKWKYFWLYSGPRLCAVHLGWGVGNIHMAKYYDKLGGCCFIPPCHGSQRRRCHFKPYIQPNSLALHMHIAQC